MNAKTEASNQDDATGVIRLNVLRPARRDRGEGAEESVRSYAMSWIFQMRIEQLTPPSLVRWKCVGGSSPDWVGTTQEFILEPQGDGEVLLKFCHGGWERGVKNPYFT